MRTVKSYYTHYNRALYQCHYGELWSWRKVQNDVSDSDWDADLL